MTTPRIVFFGTPEFAVASLSALLDSNANIAAVVTAPDKPAGRGHKLLQSDVKQFALERNIPVLQPTNLKAPEFINQLTDLGADLFIVIAFRMLPEVVWTMPRLGTFNIHASLLPRYRGAAPINHAIINGETTTGVTAFFLKHEIDTGDIIATASTPILPEDNAGTLHDKLMALGAELTVNTVRQISEGTITPLPQSALEDKLRPCPAPKIFRDNCRIDWDKPTENIHNLVRGLSPYPAAWSTLRDGDSETTVKIFDTTPLPKQSDSTPGTITVEKDTMIVATADSSIRINILQPQGKKRMTAAEYLRGAHLSPTATFINS